MDLFPWALKLPDLTKDAKTSDGKAWQAIRDQVVQETITDIRQALNRDAVAPPPNQALQRPGGQQSVTAQ